MPAMSHAARTSRSLPSAAPNCARETELSHSSPSRLPGGLIAAVGVVHHPNLWLTSTPPGVHDCDVIRTRDVIGYHGAGWTKDKRAHQ